MKKVEEHIDDIVKRVLSEEISLKAEEIMSMANEELHGGQKKLDKNNNNKIDAEDFKMLRKDKKQKPKTPAGFEHGEIVSGEVEEKLTGGQKKLDKNKNNKIDAEDFKMLRGDKKESKEVDMQWVADEVLSKDEPLYRGTKFVKEEDLEEYSFGDTATDDDLGYDDMLPSADYEDEIKKPHKVKNVGDKYQRKVSKEFKNESKKNTLQLTEDEIIDLIEKIVNEQTEVKVTNKSLKDSGKENEDHIKSVTKKMQTYLKDASKGKYETNPDQFPKGNGELAKMSKKAYTPSKAVEEYIENFAYSPGMENLQYDEIKPNEEWLEKNIEGSSMTGNAAGGNAIDTGLGKKINTKRKKNLYGKEKQKSYNRYTQPVDEAGEGAGEDSLDKMFSKLGESNEKKTKLITEDMEKIKHLLNYSKKTQ